MRYIATILTLSTLLFPALAARAGAPRVVADIAPIHALVAQVMQGAGAPGLIVPPGATPHGHTLRPSEAGRLADAGIVFWVGPGLTPWLVQPIATLAPGARLVTLIDAPGTVRLPRREGATFEDHDHHDHGADHPGADDPHAWLDPENGRRWLGVIAQALAEADPANAELYARNAAAATADLDALTAGLARDLAPLRGRPFVVFHDAFQYFEARFGLAASGALMSGDGVAPGPARIARIRDTVRALDVACVFAEPQFRDGLIATVTEGTGARPAVLDPLGTALAPGPALYADLLRAMARDMATCLTAGG